MIQPTVYKGSVKDVWGPIALKAGQKDVAGAVFHYTDSYSVFDWGRMPDSLPKKGEALSVLAADLFEKLENPETWKEFSRSAAAQSLRKGNRFGAVFNEMGEILQREGLRTHYLGVLPESAASSGNEWGTPVPLASAQGPIRRFAVRQVSVTKPKLVQVLGRSIPDYFSLRSSAFPRLVPLEVVFRFSCPEGSSLIERVNRDPSYLSSIGFGSYEVAPGKKWDFPVLELFTKLESTDRLLTLSEALAISGLSGEQLQSLLLRTAWVAGFLRGACAKEGLELADGKLEWGVDADGSLFLVDAIGPDELRLLWEGVQLSKEFLRGYYRTTPWYEAIGKAKEYARNSGSADWKRSVSLGPPHLPAEHRELASQLYLALANAMTGKKWFAEGWEISKVASVIRDLQIKGVSRE